MKPVAVCRLCVVQTYGQKRGKRAAERKFDGIPPKFLLWQQGLVVRRQLRRAALNSGAELPTGLRNATVSALNYLELARVGRADFIEMLRRFPVLRRRIIEQTRAHFDNGTPNKSKHPLRQLPCQRRAR